LNEEETEQDEEEEQNEEEKTEDNPDSILTVDQVIDIVNKMDTPKK